MLVMISIVMIISCKFHFGALVVGSESMTGEINKGDAIVYEQYDGEQIEAGQIIVFNDGPAKVIHRVIEVKNTDGELRYITKGDANEEPDYGYITDSDIVGLVNFKISYIGYPSLWIRNIFVGK